MKLTKQLMDAYIHYIQLPLTLLNDQGIVEHALLVAQHAEKEELLQELATICQHIQKSTIVSIDMLHNTELYYVITPAFKVNQAKKFMAAGPFLQTGDERLTLPTLSAEQIEQTITKMNQFYDVLTLKSQTDSRVTVPPQFIEVLQHLGDFEAMDETTEHIKNIATQLLQLEAFDFFCIAEKNEDDVFVVHLAVGTHVQKLQGKSFYIGEGLLGKAAILNKAFYWTRQQSEQRIEFLHRHGIFAEHVFGMPIQWNDTVSGMLFCGNFTNISIGEHLRQIIQCILRFMTQRLHIEQQLTRSSYVENMLSNVLDLLDVLFNTSEIKLFAYKLLDFCQQVHPDFSIIMTLPTGEQFQRGMISPTLQAAHHKHIQRAHTQFIEGNQLHLHFSHYGYVSICFGDVSDVQQFIYILTLLQMFIEKEYVAPQRNEIFEVLHTSMKEMNAMLYERTCIAVQMMEDVAQHYDWQEVKHYLRHACYVLPYSEAYLKTCMQHTAEWQYVEQVHRLLQEKQLPSAYELPVQMLAFIYYYLVKQSVVDVPFLDETLKKHCVHAYEKYTARQRMTNITSNNDVEQVIENLALTAREKEILQLIVEGLNNHEVAACLNISVHTVKNHVTNIFKKLHVSDRIQAMTKIYRMQFE